MLESTNISTLAKYFPNLRRDLRIAHLHDKPEAFIKKSVKAAAYMSLLLTVILFFLLPAFRSNLLLPAAALPVVGFLSFIFLMNTPLGMIRKREREINKEVLFAGRYLLVKMESGSPLFNSLIDASKRYGICSKYFKEIVDEINMGVPIENAIENAREFNASEKFKKVLWQIVISLKTGVDVTDALKSTLKQIASEQIIEIKEYGKKLNSIVMFYMIVACVMPSLGLTMFIIAAGFLQLQISSIHLGVIIFFLALLQLMFMSLIKAMRPMVNI
ncbi:hypothetical protein COT48_06080 [Candidatus Woesearchaeota archaeon CG08_land_8_20_14_0_20_47_9]|nr:MAG: hypothetical protein AUJ69_02830 [Candidatus Woesearchaeota archaeon CG1_02_47_18]PIO03133.1 MAG: hypothetical protein COT48_06080 [Candidatus Woesearchaeota archaeon CG08_land_8_20_14_0_20_47_9]HII29560.1 hypothetical protein [Candidatus Woesearchaeota archaeon]